MNASRIICFSLRTGALFLVLTFLVNLNVYGQKPHPSVVRITAFEKNAQSSGSGTLVSHSGEYGVVLSNWHVVRDAKGLLRVTFPDGTVSHGVVLLYDRTWDLAAIAIDKPNGALPVPIARSVPQYREPLWIAGYGAGSYRIAQGECVKYASPKIGLPREWLEVSVPARKGDSGGPIFNSDGELAGVLFGSDFRGTLGSYSGRVKVFLNQALEYLSTLPENPNELYAKIDKNAVRVQVAKKEKLVPIKQEENDENVHLTALRDGEKLKTMSGKEITIAKNPARTGNPESIDFLSPDLDIAPRLLDAPLKDDSIKIAKSRTEEKIASDYDKNHSDGFGDLPPLELQVSGVQGKYQSNFALAENAVISRESLEAGCDSDDSGVGAVIPLSSRIENVSEINPLYIIGGLLVVFFVVFHLVKILTIIEENESPIREKTKTAR